MNPNPLGYTEQAPCGAVNGCRWQVILGGTCMALDTPTGSTLILQLEPALAIAGAINAALPHMAQKFQP